MEHRVKYRDIPWGVAFGVLPGKIIGTFFIKPGIAFRCDWPHILVRAGRKLFIFWIIIVFIAVIAIAAENISGGTFSAWLNHIWSAFNE